MNNWLQSPTTFTIYCIHLLVRSACLVYACYITFAFVGLTVSLSAKSGSRFVRNLSEKLKTITSIRAKTTAVKVSLVLFGFIMGYSFREAVLSVRIHNGEGVFIVGLQGFNKYFMQEGGNTYSEEFCPGAPAFPPGVTFLVLVTENTGPCKRLLYYQIERDHHGNPVIRSRYGRPEPKSDANTDADAYAKSDADAGSP